MSDGGIRCTLDKQSETPFNADVTNSQRRWKNSLTEKGVAILENLAEELRHIWAEDSKYPKAYPLSTNDLFREAKLRLLNRKISWSRTGKLPPVPAPPKRFAELFEERDIKALYEDKFSDSYDEAIRLAGIGGQGAGKAVHKLLKVAREAYYVRMGCEYPAPRVHFLHRQLLELAEFIEIDDLTNKGLEEFFDDTCPCGKKHKAEAIRKLKIRKQSRSKGRLKRI